MDINFELYKIFYYTVVNASFTKAAEALYVTQSSISQSIKQLENKLDTKLFIRQRKKIQLTPEGEILFSHVEQAFKHIKEAERKIENHNIGEINIGASDTICKYILLPYFKAFHKAYPQIKINIVNQPSRATLEMIQEGLMDFGIVAISSNKKITDVDLIKLKEYEEVCIVGEELSEQIQSPAKLEDLLQFPMITLRSNTNTRSFLNEAFQKRGLFLQPEFEMVSVDLILEMVKADLGIGFVMEDTLTDDIKRIAIQPPLAKREVSFAISETLPLSSAAKLFIEHIKSTLTSA